MKITSYQQLKYFEFWSGAELNAEKFTYDELDALEQELELLHPNGIDETELNDLMRFSPEYLCRLIDKTWVEED